jgi:hypothetical protein
MTEQWNPGDRAEWQFESRWNPCAVLQIAGEHCRIHVDVPLHMRAIVDVPLASLRRPQLAWNPGDRAEHQIGPHWEAVTVLKLLPDGRCEVKPLGLSWSHVVLSVPLACLRRPTVAPTIVNPESYSIEGRYGLKHGPRGSGESGPCDPDCRKCAAEASIAIGQPPIGQPPPPAPPLLDGLTAEQCLERWEENRAAIRLRTDLVWELTRAQIAAGREGHQCRIAASEHRREWWRQRAVADRAAELTVMVSIDPEDL